MKEINLIECIDIYALGRNGEVSFYIWKQVKNDELYAVRTMCGDFDIGDTLNDYDLERVGTLNGHDLLKVVQSSVGDEIRYQDKRNE